MKRFGILLAAFAITLTGMAPQQVAAAEEAYPTRPIKIILPYRPGGQSDLTARKIAEISAKYNFLEQPMVVTSMPGANTRTALRYVKEATPDGYTLLLHHSTFLAMHALGQIPMSFRDYEMVGQALRMPMSAFISLPDAPWKNWVEMVEYAKKSKEPLSIALAGLGGTTHTMYAYLTSATNTGHLFKPVFFSGQTESKTALMGKKVAAYGDAPVGGIGLVVSGGGKLLIMSDDLKRPDFPDANNFAELGIKSLVYMRNGLYAPKGTPRPIMDKLQNMLQKVVATPEYQEYAKKQYCYADFLPGKDYYAQFEKDEKVFQSLADIVKKSIEEQKKK